MKDKLTQFADKYLSDRQSYQRFEIEDKIKDKAKGSVNAPEIFDKMIELRIINPTLSGGWFYKSNSTPF